MVSFTNSYKRQLKVSKATGLDDVPSRLLEDSALTIREFLTHIVNLSITCQRIPHGWKHAKVIPLYKEGARDNIDNYRPISILAVVSKILERPFPATIGGLSGVARPLYQISMWIPS